MPNKPMSALLYQLYPANPHLIQTSLKPFFKRTPQLSKQKYGREGDYIYNSQNYGENNFNKFLQDSYINFVHKPLFQKYIQSKPQKNRYIIISCWVIFGKPCGIVIREDINPIIGTGSSVVPYDIQQKKLDEEPIKLELTCNQNQALLRKSIYGNEDFYSSDNMIQIANKINLSDRQQQQMFKSKLIEQSTHSKKIKQEQLQKGQMKKYLQLGFSPAIMKINPGQTQINRQDENFQEDDNYPYQGGYGGSGGSSDQYQLTSNANGKNGKPGSTRQRFHSHS
ncbi:hypothetical protein ABPG72_011633 [Tetrahymena utriculariae]